MGELICEKCNIRDCECVPYDVECDSCIRAYKQGREDAFLEIANSDCVKKEQFEILAYKKGARDFAEWVSRKHGINACVGLINSKLAYEELDFNEVLKQFEKQGAKVEEQKGGTE